MRRNAEHQVVQDLPQLINRDLLTGAIVGVLIHTAPGNFCVFTAPHRINDHGHPIGSGAFHDTAQQAPGGLGHILFLKLSQAVGTVAAIIGPVFPKISQDILPEAFIGHTVKRHLFQPVPAHARGSAPRRLIHILCTVHLIDQKLVGDHILSRII